MRFNQEAPVGNVHVLYVVFFAKSEPTRVGERCVLEMTTTVISMHCDDAVACAHTHGGGACYPRAA